MVYRNTASPVTFAIYITENVQRMTLKSILKSYYYGLKLTRFTKNTSAIG